VQRHGDEQDLLRGDHVALRSRHPDDIPVLHAELYNDVTTRTHADSRPWRPIRPDPELSPYAAPDQDDTAFFSVVAVEEGELAGEALLWGIDQHNRMAHLGLALRPSFRGRGWSVEVLRLLCLYGFDVRGLNRLQLETAEDNRPMIAAATRAGFEIESTLRQATWILGNFVDTVIMWFLAANWRDTRKRLDRRARRR
jgi:RimJ/RimL family protein N-acetyltransferase